MKFIITLLLAVLLVSSTYSSEVQDVEQFVEGLLIGAFGDVGHKVEGCFDEGDKMFEDIEQAIVLFEKGDFASVVAGITLIGQALEELPLAVQKCESLEDVAKELEKIAEEFKDPQALIVHVSGEILWHGVSIFHDVTKSVSDFNAHKYEPAGEDIGDIIKILFVNKLESKREDAVEFIEGFFKGSLRDSAVDVNDCIEDVDEIIDELEKIMTDIESGILVNPEQVFLDFIDLLSEIPKSVVQCEIVPADLEKFEGWVQDLEDMKIMEHRLFNAFLIYPDRVKEDSKDTIDEYKTLMFSESGFHLGDLMYVLFELVNPMEESKSVVQKLLN